MGARGGGEGLTDSTRARHARGTRERLRTLRGRLANALTTIAGQQLDRASDVAHSHDYSFGRMNMPCLLLLFFDDICVARVYIRVRGSYLVSATSALLSSLLKAVAAPSAASYVFNLLGYGC